MIRLDVRLILACMLGGFPLGVRVSARSLTPILPAPVRLADDSAGAKSKVQKIDADKFDEKRKEKDAVVLDVRTPDEFKEGHIPGATNLDFFDPQFNKKVAELDKSRTYLVHCARDVRSRQAAARMEKMGFANLFDLDGGFDAWVKDGKPVQK